MIKKLLPMPLLYYQPSPKKIPNISRGITLIETLIALMITGIISVICFRAVSSSITVKNHLTQHLQSIDELSQAWNIIDLDLSQICIYPQLALLKHNKNMFLAPHALNAYPNNSLTFMRYRSPYHEKHIIEEVSYLVEKNQLIRTIKKIGSTKEKYVLLNNIEHISFSGYFSEKKQWQTIKKHSPFRPSAINVIVTTQNNITYNRVFLVSVIS